MFGISSSSSLFPYPFLCSRFNISSFASVLPTPSLREQALAEAAVRPILSNTSFRAQEREQYPFVFDSMAKVKTSAAYVDTTKVSNEAEVDWSRRRGFSGRLIGLTFLSTLVPLNCLIFAPSLYDKHYFMYSFLFSTQRYPHLHHVSSINLSLPCLQMLLHPPLAAISLYPHRTTSHIPASSSSPALTPRRGSAQERQQDGRDHHPPHLRPTPTRWGSQDQDCGSG